MVHKVIKVQSSLLEQDKGKGIYHTIQSAIDHARPGDIIEIGKGRYKEKLEITTPGLTFVGEASETCIITFDDYARKQHRDGREYGTFRSYTCLVLADDVTFDNLTIENNAGDGRQVGQAIALFAQGDRLHFRNCRLIGCQDTLFAGPLPPNPNIPGSFVGPTENREYSRSRQYYDNCYITGDIDFIFGSALAVFKQCKLVARDRGEAINAFITAPSTWEGEPYGFVFIDSDFVGEEGIAQETVYFGRPWRPYAQVTLIHCSYDGSIHKDHWDPWGNEENKKTTRFSEYGCFTKEAPFIVRKNERPKIDFLDPWHIKMLACDKTRS